MSFISITTPHSFARLMRELAPNLSSAAPVYEMMPKLNIPALYAGLSELADVTADPAEFVAVCKRLGWSVSENDSAPADEVVLEVVTPYAQHRLLAVFAEPSMAGVPLAVLVDDDDCPSPLYVTTRDEFDHAYAEALAQIEQIAGPPTTSGTYVSRYAPGTFSYALWPRRGWYVALVEHDEGDGNYGHGPTLDLRLLPVGDKGETPVFPLETNLVF